jgi:anti-sigma regulatory factor (Ser/Thr protein kinase)
VIGSSELRIVCYADTSNVRLLRHALRSFLDVFALERALLEDILTASGEVLSNAVEHGCDESGRSSVELIARGGNGNTLAIEVSDEGQFVNRARLPDRGFGLGIVRAIANNVIVKTGRGTRVEMTFETSRTGHRR